MSVTVPVRIPRFFVTSAAPCPYLPGRTERKVFTELNGPHADALNDALGRIGFRRSQTVAYRPSCGDCTACVSVRVVAGEFSPSATQRRELKRNSDLVATLCQPWSTAEQFELLQRYLAARHPGGPACAGLAGLRPRLHSPLWSGCGQAQALALAGHAGQWLSEARPGCASTGAGLRYLGPGLGADRAALQPDGAGRRGQRLRQGRDAL